MLRPFVDQRQKDAAKLGLQWRITAQTGSMDSLPFEDEGFDLIWSEGAISNMGFEKGLKARTRFLKPGGYIAVSEISWFTDARPEELDDFWTAAYPEFDSLSGNVATMQRAGDEVVASFKLPENCWTENYYAPREKIVDDFLKAHPGNAAAETLVAEQREEAVELY